MITIATMGKYWPQAGGGGGLQVVAGAPPYRQNAYEESSKPFVIVKNVEMETTKSYDDLAGQICVTLKDDD